MNNDWERIIELGSEIKTVRNQLRNLEAEFATLMNKGGPIRSSSSSEPPVNIFDNGAPLTERVIKFLESHRGHSFSAVSIADGIGLDREKINSMRSTLVRLVDEQRIERPTPGMHKAKEEQEHNAA